MWANLKSKLLWMLAGAAAFGMAVLAFMSRRKNPVAVKHLEKAAREEAKAEAIRPKEVPTEFDAVRKELQDRGLLRR